MGPDLKIVMLCSPRTPCARIAARCAASWRAAESQHYRACIRDRLPETARYVVEVIRARYPDLRCRFTTAGGMWKRAEWIAGCVGVKH